MATSVLIVDDEPVTNDMIADLVRTRGYEPIQFLQGSGVVEAAQTLRPDVILLDLMLPDVDGMAICEQLKRDRTTNLIPVVMVTALNDLSHRTQGVRVGANEYIPKPFRAEQLFKAIDRVRAWRDEHNRRGTEGEIDFDIRSEVSYLQQINDMLADMFAHTRLSDKQIKDLRQAIMEMGGNAIEWGHRKNAELPLRITYRIDPDSITLIIRDQGPGFDPTDLPHAAKPEDPISHLDLRGDLGIRDGGFGIMLARGLVDEFRYNEKGNEVTLVKRFPKAAGEAPAR
ncbi:MAG: response regulator [Isosphaeraceae bacterium]